MITTASGTQNCTFPNTNWIYPYPTTYQYVSPPLYQVRIRTCTNGFITEIDGQEHVSESLNSLLKLIESHFREDKCRKK